MAIKDKNGEMMKKPFYPLLASDRVCHVGQAVAFVVAETAEQAQDAVDLIEVEYADTPAVVTFTPPAVERVPPPMNIRI